MRRHPGNPRKGSALLVTLGLLAIASALVFAFALSTRTERLSARRADEGFCASEHLDSALSIAMTHHLSIFLRNFDSSSDAIYHSSGMTGGFDRWQELFPASSAYFKPSIATSFDIGHGSGSVTNFLWNQVTNHLPGALLPQLEDCTADWIPIEVVDENSATGEILSTNALLAYAIIDLSGFLDAGTITSNQAAWLEGDGTDIDDTGRFLEDRLAQTPGDGGYVTYRDLVQRNRGLARPPSHLLHSSLDIAPDVTSTGRVVYGSNDAEEADAGGYLAKFDLNSWTNGFKGDLDDSEALASHYASDEFRKGWLEPVTNRLAWCGFAAAEEIAWNLVNFMDGDRIPQGPGGVQWREEWPVEDVPLINEIAVAQVPSSFGGGGSGEGGLYTNCYATAIELWYPFATNAVTAEDEAQLVTAIYTNWPPDRATLADPGWTNGIIYLPEDDSHGFTVSNAIPGMRHGTSTEFLVFSLPPPYLSFPVSMTNLSATGTGPLYHPVEDGDWSKVGPWEGGSDGTDGDGRHLKASTCNLPIGIQVYSTYVRTDSAADIWERREITVTNEIRLITRVKLRGQWVDEAMAYDPHDARYDEGPYPFREPCGFEVNDPRRNGPSGDWIRYTGGDATDAPEDGTVGGDDCCALSATTNAICNPWHPYGQGLPVIHYNAPLRRAGDIGYIHEPYSRRFLGDGDPRPYDEHAVQTNDWQSICLADARIMQITNHYSFAAGSALEFFTVRCATNAPVRGLVSASTPWPTVVGALASDIEVGAGFAPAHFDKAGIAWVTNVFFDIQRTIFGSLSIPVGIGDFCMGAGLVDSYRSAASIDEGSDAWHWRGSLGNDSKEDLLRELCERISFRQQIYGVYLVARSTTPAMTIAAERKALAIVLRDGYTGAWRILNWINL